MTRVPLLLLCTAVLASATLGLPAPQAGSEPKERLIFGYLSGHVRQVDIRDARAALTLWVEELGLRAGIQSEARVFESRQKIHEAFRHGEIDIAAIMPYDYLLMENAVEHELGFAPVRSGSMFTQYVILVRSDLPRTHLTAFKRARLAHLGEDKLAQVFLNTLLLRQRQPEMHRFFSAVHEKAKSSAVVHACYFGQADVCLVSSSAYQKAAEMNPRIGRELKVLATSPELIRGVSIFRKGYSPATRKQAMDVSLRLQDNPRGRQILALFQMERIEAIQERHLSSLRNLYREYRTLKGKTL